VTNTQRGAPFKRLRVPRALSRAALSLEPTPSAQARIQETQFTNLVTLTWIRWCRVDLKLKPGGADETEAAMGAAVALDTE